MSSFPSINELNKLDDKEAVSHIRKLFETSSVLENFVLSLRPWKSYEDIIDQSTAFIASLVKDKMNDCLDILNAHPKIGAKKETLSEHSKKEQGADGDPETLKKLADMNEAYEKRHGFRFVVFVNGRPKDVILKILEERIDNESKAEMKTALQAMMDIAKDRLKKSKI